MQRKRAITGSVGACLPARLRCVFSFVAAILLAVCTNTSVAQRQHPAPPQHASASPPHAAAPPPRYAPPPGRGSQPGNQHLAEWLQRNRGLSPQQQQRALQREPGFNRLPPQQQQRLTNRLQQLDRMPPRQRQRTLERVENMERLSPAKKQEVRGAAQQLGQLPPERQQAMRRAMRDLRDVPSGLRQSELNSQRYSSQFSAEERGIMGNLLTVEPYHPQPPPQR